MYTSGGFTLTEAPFLGVHTSENDLSSCDHAPFLDHTHDHAPYQKGEWSRAPGVVASDAAGLPAS